MVGKRPGSEARHEQRELRVKRLQPTLAFGVLEQSKVFMSTVKFHYFYAEHTKSTEAAEGDP